jgi:hypothetical protein
VFNPIWFDACGGGGILKPGLSETIVVNFSNVFVLEQSVFKTKQLRSLLLKLAI